MGMDKNIYLDKFVKTIDELKKDIIALNKDDSQQIILIEDIENSKIKLLESFYENCNQVCDEFSTKNAIIFKKDNSILENIDLYQLWNCDITDEMKEGIWKYLFTMYLYANNYVNDEELGTLINKYKSLSQDEISKLEKNNKITYSIIDYLNIEDKLNHTVIGKLAKEIASEINPEEFAKNITKEDTNNLISNLLNGNMDQNSGVMKLINHIGGKINEKMSNQEFDESTLFNEAQDILGNQKLFSPDNNFNFQDILQGSKFNPKDFGQSPKDLKKNRENKERKNKLDKKKELLRKKKKKKKKDLLKKKKKKKKKK